MRPKSLALLLLALGCGLVASIGITRVMTKPGEGENTAAATGILVAATDIAMNDRLTPEMVKMVQWPKDTTPPGAISKLEDIENRRARTKIFAGESILDKRLTGKGAGLQSASDSIPVGYRVVPVKVDLVSGGSDLIMPGNRVDVMLHLVRDPNRGINETVTRTILQDIKVFAVNDVLDMEKEKDGSKSIAAKTISLLVTPQQAATMMLATQTGVVNLVMRSAEEDKKDGRVEARISQLVGGAGSSPQPNVEARDPPVVKQPPVLAVATPPVQAPIPRITWTMQVLRGNTLESVVFEKNGDGDSKAPFDSWRVAAPANVAAPSPPKIEPPREPVVEPAQKEPDPKTSKPIRAPKQNQAIKPLVKDNSNSGPS
jgi:pilus assembly protein CpaB